MPAEPVYHTATPYIIWRKQYIIENVEITHRWADEDLGRNCGQRIYYGGSCIEAYYPEAYAEGLSFAAELWEIDPEEAFAEDNQDVTDGGMEY